MIVAKRQLLKVISLKKTVIFLFLVIIDLLSKYIVFNYIDLYQFIKITNFLDITHIHNFGVAFGLFSGVIPSLVLIFVGMMVVFFYYISLFKF